MIPGALLVPTEFPDTALDIKRALLTFDQVSVFDPVDRDLIPPQAYVHAMTGRTGFPVPLGIYMGRVAPLGKLPDYMERLERTLEELRALRDVGKIALLPAPPERRGMFLGAIPLPDGSPDPVLTYHLYRLLSEQAEWVNRAVFDVTPNTLREHLEDLSPESRDAGMRLNDGPAQAEPRTGDDLDKDTRAAVARMAYARIGSLVRTAFWAAASDLAPLATQPVPAALMRDIQIDVAYASDGLDPELTRYMLRLHRVVVEDVIDASVLEDVSARDLLQLRDKAWGRAGEQRIRLFSEVRKLAADCTDDDEFDRRVANEIERYRRTWAEYRSDKARLFRNLLIATGAEIATGGLALALGPAGGLVWGLVVAGMGEVAKYGGELKDMRDRETELVAGSSFGIGNAYGYALPPRR
jgi:hypothetical protein